MKDKFINRNARLWINYLKTNPPKTRKMLEDAKNPTARCCLGHACFMLDVEKIIEDGKVFYDGLNQTLSTKVMKKLGLKTASGAADFGFRGADKNFIRNHRGAPFFNLASLNDQTNKSHKEIAEIIEINAEILFKEIK